jgi:hypothetical protein
VWTWAFHFFEFCTNFNFENIAHENVIFLHSNTRFLLGMHSYCLSHSTRLILHLWHPLKICTWGKCLTLQFPLHKLFLFLFIYFFCVRLEASHLQSRYSTAEPHLQSILLCLYWRWGSRELCAQAVLKPRSSQSQPLKYRGLQCKPLRPSYTSQVLSLAVCVTLGRLLNLSGPGFSPIQNGDEPCVC